MAAARKKAVEVAEVAAAPAVTVYSIKGFNQDLRCRGYQFAVGETFLHEGSVKACKGGFHACTVEAHPLSVFDYYPPAGSRFHEVVQQGETHSDDGIKIASATITIGIELTIGDLVKRAWDYVWSRATKSDEAHVTIEQGAASATGEQGAASATGWQGAASATGTRGAASATGYEGRVSGEDGNALFAVERDRDWNIVSVACGIVGQDGLTAGTWYQARAGKLVEAV